MCNHLTQCKIDYSCYISQIVVILLLLANNLGTEQLIHCFVRNEFQQRMTVLLILAMFLFSQWMWMGITRVTGLLSYNKEYKIPQELFHISSLVISSYFLMLKVLLIGATNNILMAMFFETNKKQPALKGYWPKYWIVVVYNVNLYIKIMKI